MWYRIFSTLTREFFRFNLYLIFLTIRSFLLCCSTEPMLIVSNCNFPMTRSVILLVGLLVSHNFLKGGKLHFHASIGALVYYLIISNYFTSRKIALGYRDWFSWVHNVFCGWRRGPQNRCLLPATPPWLHTKPNSGIQQHGHIALLILESEASPFSTAELTHSLPWSFSL